MLESRPVPSAPLNLTHCTLTGVDKHTDLVRIAELSQEFPIAEWGLLYSPSNQGEPGRYPATALIIRALKQLPPHVRVALHVCGPGVPNLIDGYPPELKLVEMVAVRGGRVQLNFNSTVKPITVTDLEPLFTYFSSTTFITQHNKANAHLWDSMVNLGLANYAVLHDSSGGRGVACEEWPQPLSIPCGYAGGLGPDTLQAELDKIALITEGKSTWVDMESKLRSIDARGADWLNLETCKTCLSIAQTRTDS